MYCLKCGNKTKDESEFCDTCEYEIQRSVTLERRMKKINCPQCGATINTLLNKCESCGTEFRELNIAKSIKEFTQKLLDAESDRQRIVLIKSFPIPNTKEDIMEYMILASSNIGYNVEAFEDEDAEEYEEAWMTKFLQSYQKAKLVFADDRFFPEIQKMYENTLARRENADTERKQKKLVNLIIRNLGTSCGVFALCIAAVMDNMKINASILELVGSIVLIASANNLKNRKTVDLEYALAAGSGFTSIALSFLFDNGSMLMFGGVITIIVSVASYIKKSA